ncbi:MAG: NH(3)-dependent NAD+ synthetase NadE, NAD+ synthase [Candidatus Peregrinibacteria bacterium GW2011_GWC2_33_13]|nr:MAG: NH(3)-dependent NAD+ synthetase NadE, NAD+ synthase [Candidatus Peregrinibacteria bacterium GW2011_GWC2_33_13]
MLEETDKNRAANPMADIYNQLIKSLQKFYEKNKFHKVVIGLSGGIDSTLTLKIAVEALGPDNVTGIIMPELGLTQNVNIDHAKKLAEYFEIDYYYIPINPFLIDFRLLPWKPKEAEMNTKARVRMCILYNYANTMNAAVLGTSNKSEIVTGYFTKYGDGGCDIEVIGDLTKTEVFKLAKFLELPEEIINKTPSAELHPNQSDEQDMGITYKELDTVIKFEKEGIHEAIGRGINPVLANKVFHIIEKNEHKRKMPPIIKLNKTL